MGSSAVVSVKAMESPLGVLRTSPVTVEEVLAGTRIDPAQLSVPTGHISWDDFCIVMDRLQAIAGGPDAFVRAGGEFMKAPRFRAFVRLSCLFVNIQTLYGLTLTVGGRRLFPGVRTSLTVLGDDSLRIDMHSPDDGRPGDAFFRYNVGAYRVLPRLFGSPDSLVEYQITGRHCVYTIRHTKQVPLLHRIRLFLFAPFAGASAFHELVERNEALQESLVELSAARARAERASDVKSEILRNISHELRTPLNAVIGIAELAGAEENDPAKHEALGEILVAATKMARLIDRLIETANPTVTVAEAPFDLNELVREMIAEVEGDARLKGIRLEAPAPVVHATRRGDARRVRTIVAELLDNAIKFSSTGRVSMRVVEEDERSIRLEVEDEAGGIPPEHLPFVFDAFRQGDGSLERRHGGMGLGLSLVKSAVTQLGGTIEIDNAVGRGARFIVRLRLEPVEPESSQETGALTALVVEDNPVNQKVLVRMLEGAAIRVSTASNGVEAVAKVRESPFDLILMDCQMPEMDGFEATKHIRALDPPKSQTPIIAVSAHGDGDYERTCRAAGMDGFLPKPVRKTEIRNLIASARRGSLRSCPSQARDPGGADIRR